MAIFLRYAAMFRVGTSFIFSRIKSRSASVTLNLICTVLLRPSMFSLLSIPRVWDTSQQAIFNRRAAAQEGENTEVGTRFLCLLRMFFIFYAFISLYGEKAILPNLYKRKTLQSAKITTLPKIHIQFFRTFSFVLFFDFLNFFRRCGYNPYSLITHSIKQCIELPTLRVFCVRLL